MEQWSTGHWAVSSWVHWTVEAQDKDKDKYELVTLYAFHICILNMTKKRAKEVTKWGLRTDEICRTKGFRLSDSGESVLDDNVSRLGKISHIHFEN